MFTDIEGSTRLLQTLGARYGAALERHHQLLRACWRDHAGVEVKTDGDAFFVVFEDPAAAVAAAACAQRSLAAEPWSDGQVRVRIGIHTGAGLLGADDYVGLDVHRAARIAAAGHGGQILLSGATRALVERRLPDGVTLADLGHHRLKDLDEPERLAQLNVAGLETDSSPLRSLDARPTNLPPLETAIVGRSREMEQVRAAIVASRLVTLTGAGGSGKSTLALAVAESLRNDFPDGVFVSWLAPIRDPDLVAGAIATPLGVQEFRWTDRRGGSRLPSRPADLARARQLRTGCERCRLPDRASRGCARAAAARHEPDFARSSRRAGLRGSTPAGSR